MRRPNGLAALLPDVVEIAEEAGAAVLVVYAQSDYAVRQKPGRGPVTRADLVAHDLLVARLGALVPDIPIVSEESLAPSYTERRAWRRFWLIDPLDGTKEFIAHIDEFAINIALIEDGRPVMGVVAGPALTVTYFAANGLGAFKLARGGSWQRIASRPFGEAPLKIVGSRFREDEALRSFLRRLGPADCVRMGSALKFCAIAEGGAHLYPQLGPTMEWDTAAGQAILEAAGGAVIDASGADLRYNKLDLRNPPFVASSDRAHAWHCYLP